MFKRNWMVAAAAAVALPGCVTVADPGGVGAVSPRSVEEAVALTPDHFKASAKIDDDDLDVVANISTLGGMVKRQGLLGVVWNDNFLRALIDKKTGRITFQVYQYINYEGDWRFYETVNYETPDGPVQKRLIQISRDVLSCSGSRYSTGCSYSEHFAFEVDEALLRTIAAGYQPGAAVVWKFKFGAQRAEDWNDAILPAEVAGFLQAVDEYRAASSTPTK
nr:MAG TPA: hypothetical protein [Caudoviricetes sp.]